MSQASGRPVVSARVELLGVEDSEPTRVRMETDEDGQYVIPFGAIDDDAILKQLYAQGRQGDADWQPVLLQRVRGQLQLQLPPALLAAASDGMLIDLQIGVFPDSDLAATHPRLYQKFMQSRDGRSKNKTLQTMATVFTWGGFLHTFFSLYWLFVHCQDPIVFVFGTALHLHVLNHLWRSCMSDLWDQKCNDVPAAFIMVWAFFLYEQPARMFRYICSFFQRQPALISQPRMAGDGNIWTTLCSLQQ